MLPAVCLSEPVIVLFNPFFENVDAHIALCNMIVILDVTRQQSGDSFNVLVMGVRTLAQLALVRAVSPNS